MHVSNRICPCLVQVSIVGYIRNVCTLKNKYNLMLCQSRLHTASEIFIRPKKIGSGSIFFSFFASVASILRGVLTVQSHRTSERQNPEWRLSSSSTSFLTQSTLNSQKLVVFFLICGSSIASIKLSH